MKRATSVSALFGMSHREMAMVLGISYSQWSMYECGKRGLPVHTAQLLAEMLSHVQSPDSGSKRESYAAVYDEPRLAHAQKLLKENEYQRLLASRKLAALEKKIESEARLDQIAGFFASRQIDGKADRNPHRRALASKAGRMDLEANHITNFELSLQLELLELEKLLLESKIRKIAESREFKGRIDEK